MNLRHEAAMNAARAINAETERWMMKAIERGPGWNVWRSNARMPPYDLSAQNAIGSGDVIALRYEFMLVRDGDHFLADGVIYKQPDPGDPVRRKLLNRMASAEEYGPTRAQRMFPGCDEQTAEDFYREKGE